MKIEKAEKAAGLVYTIKSDRKDIKKIAELVKAADCAGFELGVTIRIGSAVERFDINKETMLDILNSVNNFFDNQVQKNYSELEKL